jgi:hypothetical protein
MQEKCLMTCRLMCTFIYQSSLDMVPGFIVEAIAVLFIYNAIGPHQTLSQHAAGPLSKVRFLKSIVSGGKCLHYHRILSVRVTFLIATGVYLMELSEAMRPWQNCNFSHFNSIIYPFTVFYPFICCRGAQGVIDP